jgi:dinuclear metal center YbgI/SA1388 family protein
MVRVSDVLNALEVIAPQRYTFEFDKVGLQVGDPHAEVRRGVLALDRSLGAVEHCKSVGAELLLTHHPLIFQPIQTVVSQSDPGRTVLELARNNINFIAAHTNWDSAVGGINDALCTLLDLQSVRPFGFANAVRRTRVEIACEGGQEEALSSFLSEFGATDLALREGTIVATIREELTTKVERAFAKSSWPRPVLYAIADDREQPAGRIGSLRTPLPIKEFVANLDSVLKTKSLVWSKPNLTVKKVAVVGGAADGEWIAAQRAGADVFVTGEVKQHVALAACEGGLAITSSGHYATEQPGVFALADRLRIALPEVSWEVYEPELGTFGRPYFL